MSVQGRREFLASKFADQVLKERGTKRVLLFADTQRAATDLAKMFVRITHMRKGGIIVLRTSRIPHEVRSALGEPGRILSCKTFLKKFPQDKLSVQELEIHQAKTGSVGRAPQQKVKHPPSAIIVLSYIPEVRNAAFSEKSKFLLEGVEKLKSISIPKIHIAWPSKRIDIAAVSNQFDIVLLAFRKGGGYRLVERLQKESFQPKAGSTFEANELTSPSRVPFDEIQAHLDLLYRALLKAEQRYRVVLDRSAEAILVIDRDGVIRDFNRPAANLFGLQHPLGEGRRFQAFVDKDSRFSAEQILARLFERPEGLLTTVRLVDAEKHSFDAEISGGCIESHLAQLHVRDLREHLELRRQVDESELRFRALVEHSLDGIALDAGEKFLYVNDAFVKMFGYESSDELIGQEITKVIVPEDRPNVLERSHRREAGELAINRYEYRGVRKDGSVIDVEVTATSLEIDGQITSLSFHRDVTERHRLERELRESEQLFRNVIEAMGDAAVITDLNWRVITVNKEFERLTGFRRNEVVGEEFPYPWLDSEHMARFIQWISELREKSSLHDFDMDWRSKDGRRIAVSLNTTLLRNRYGEPSGILSIARDITERKRLIEELTARTRQMESLNRMISRANETPIFNDVFRIMAEELRELFHPRGIWFAVKTSGEAETLFFSDVDRTRDVLEIPRQLMEHFLGQESIFVADLSSPEWQELEQQFSLSSRGCRFLVACSARTGVTGNSILLMSLSNAIVLSDRDRAYLRSVTEQAGLIAERIYLFQTVEADAEYVHSLLNSIDSPILTLNRSLCLQEFNRAWRELQESAPHDFTGIAERGTHLQKIFADPTRWHRYRSILEEIRHGMSGSYTEEVTYETTAGLKTYQLRLNPLIVRGQVQGLVLTNTDITEIKKTEQQLYLRNRELDDFTYIVSHDLKEPLVSIEGYSNILREELKDKIDEKGEEFLSAIMNSARKLRTLIDDLLKLSRIGRTGGAMEDVPLKELIEEVLQEFAILIKARNAVIHVEEPLGTVRGNRVQLSMVIQNLVSNGLKFNDKKIPTIHLSSEDRGTEIVLRVTDNGIGIDPKFFDRIFMIFQRLHGDDMYEGTGVGLTIVKKIVEAHGGSVWVDSKPGEGATFFVALPKGGNGA
ncbi:MAG: PAS domain S-box protein [Bacteroidota bacterium]